MGVGRPYLLTRVLGRGSCVVLVAWEGRGRGELGGGGREVSARGFSDLRGDFSFSFSKVDTSSSIF